MLGVLCARPPKPWIISPHSFSLHHYNLHPNHHQQPSLATGTSADGGASIWRVMLPAEGGCGGDWRRDYLRTSLPQHDIHRGEGSWNVAWDARPARWLHRLDFACLLLGVCLCLAPSPIDRNDNVQKDEAGGEAQSVAVVGVNGGYIDGNSQYSNSCTYKVTGVPADGRCLFRAIAHGACLQSGWEAPDENHQKELADELRAQVVDELLKRRKEVEWFIEEDFDTYVKRIQEPYVWGGEPELLMASHCLKTPISVYMKDKTTGNLTNTANYGQEYQKEKMLPVKELFHGYGHYDILETFTDQIWDDENL